MTEETRRHIFEPFFSTKGAEGTGLGLATVYGIVQQNHGGIHVVSRPGAGTAFQIWLPQATTSIPLPLDAPEGSIAQASGTILVVEDHEGVRELVTSVLRSLGYQILGADTAEEALLIAGDHPVPIDLLMTDVVLPGMNGRELSEQFSAIHPGARVLFTSGYTSDAVARRGVSEGRFAFLPKPYSAEELAEKVAEVLR